MNIFFILLKGHSLLNGKVANSISEKYAKRLQKYDIYMAKAHRKYGIFIADSFIWQKIWQDPKNMTFAIYNIL
jgi:hypothetical protein